MLALAVAAILIASGLEIVGKGKLEPVAGQNTEAQNTGGPPNKTHTDYIQAEKRTSSMDARESFSLNRMSEKSDGQLAESCIGMGDTCKPVSGIGMSGSLIGEAQPKSYQPDQATIERIQRQKRLAAALELARKRDEGGSHASFEIYVAWPAKCPPGTFPVETIQAGIRVCR